MGKFGDYKTISRRISETVTENQCYHWLLIKNRIRSFDWYAKSTTLDDLGWLSRTLLNKYASFKSTTETWKKIGSKCSPRDFSFYIYSVYADIRWVSWTMCVKRGYTCNIKYKTFFAHCFCFTCNRNLTCTIVDLTNTSDTVVRHRSIAHEI